jgi:hypothetical protein
LSSTQSRRTALFVLAAVVVMVLAGVGRWNPRGHVIVADLLDHPLVAAEIVIVLLIAARCPPASNVVERLTPPLLVLALIASPLLVARVVEDDRFSSELPVPGTDLFVQVRGFNWRTGQDPVGSLYLREGSGVLQRQVFIGTSNQVYDDTSLRAVLVEPGRLRVEWQWARFGPSGQHWDIWFAPDTLRPRRVESSNGCAPRMPEPCIDVSADR